MRKQEHLVNIISFTKTGNRLARQIKSILEQKQENSHKADRKIVVNLQDRDRKSTRLNSSHP